MKTTTISKNITELRKKAGLTQEQLANDLHISPQAVSKWETDVCQPDTAMLPALAKRFGVSIDYLFYGEDISYHDIYSKNTKKVSAHPQMSKNSYEDALRIFASAHHGISRGNLRGKELMYDEPSHMSSEGGLSLLSGRGYGAIVTRSFFEHIDRSTAEFAAPILSVLGHRNCLLVIMAIISMNDISYAELKEELRAALDALISVRLVTEKESKHKLLGTTYELTGMYHTCVCVLIATLGMEQQSLKGISCCMGAGDYPISF